jgi:hypothetical protein
MTSSTQDRGSNVSRRVRVLLAAAAGLLLVACEGVEPGEPEIEANPIWRQGEPRSTLFGEGGTNLLGGSGSRSEDDTGGGIGVNSFLWRASLDTISFMPVNSADPFGGVIITDWHASADAPNERFKLNVYILGRTLRADGIRVAVFRQIQDPRLGWRDAPVPAKTDTRIEDAILTRARQLRLETLQQ